ncbi:hypothetical protein [Amycolatopsis solani]|uniref:linalool dehydratase/isomerase domain-containing protein n=1 Tax=Amycolatopsis solani TaxID=3028615 RepID=UPI0025B131C1|nr:hypothetical protein [Amycolatopsis sp. MEP2-6]
MTNTIESGPRTRQQRNAGPAPLLSDAQVGHIRHIDNLSRLPRGDWRHMAGPLPFQEDFSAYRYQLGYMSLAMALAHYHQLPAAPGVFRGQLDRLIRKMLEPDVWSYWRDTSTQGGYGPFALPRLPSRADPVAVDNIMYSAYLQVMTLMYTMLFDDRTYEQPGSLSFALRPVLWGKDRHERFEYDQRSLNERIYWNMVENGYLGVACEPFCVFQVCNQVPILGFRLHDHLYGGDLAAEVTQGYLRAWEQFGGGLNENGHFASYVVQQNELLPQDVLVDHDTAWTDGWLGMLLNMWRPELVRRTYRDKIEHWLDRGSGGRIAVRGFSRIPGSEDLVAPGTLGEIGWLAAWASEMGDREVADGILGHADTYLNPQWENGGLYYPRRDETYDEAGHFVSVIPTVSNATFPYARLNVADGLRTLFERPWTDRERSRPALTEVGREVDVRRAWYHEDTRCLQLSVSPMHGRPAAATDLTISRVWDRGAWALTVDGRTVARGGEAGVEPTAEGQRLEPRRVDDGVRISLELRGRVDLELVWSKA